MAEPPEFLSLSSVDPAHAGRPAFNVGSVLRKTFSSIGANVVPFLAITLVMLSPLIALNYLTSYETFTPQTHPTALSFLKTVLQVVLPQLVTATLMFGVFEHLLGRDATWTDCIVKGFRRAPMAMLTGLLVGLATIGGMLLCLVPGLYAAIVCSVSVPVSVLEGKSAIAAMKRSRSLTIGHGWTILASFLVVTVPVAVGGGAIGLSLARHPVAASSALSSVQALQTMWQAAMSCVMYHGLRATEEDLDLAEIARVFE